MKKNTIQSVIIFYSLKKAIIKGQKVNHEMVFKISSGSGGFRKIYIN